MKVNKEKLILQIMKECEADGEPVTREEAEEMAEAEINSNAHRRYEQAEEKKARKPKEKKVDLDKAEIIKILHKALIENGYNAEIANVDKIINFGEYTINLVKHRPPK